MKQNIFHKIIKGTTPSYKLLETDLALAILDIEPATIGHSLIIPKRHVQNVAKIDEKSGSDIMQLIKFLSLGLKDFYGYDYVKFFSLNGKAQEFDHMHVHVLGKYSSSTEDFYKATEFTSNPERYYETTQKNLISQLQEYKMPDYIRIHAN